MRRLMVVSGVVLALVMGLTGCANDGARTMVDGGYMVGVTVDLPDGRSVVCVIGASGKSVSCDWENAR